VHGASVYVAEKPFDYPANLGIDAIWISLIYLLPMADSGYDVADYCDVNPALRLTRRRADAGTSSCGWGSGPENVHPGGLSHFAKPVEFNVKAHRPKGRHFMKEGRLDHARRRSRRKHLI
jgi:hypothetical protein